MREKLIELLDEVQVCGEDFNDYELYGVRYPCTVSNECVADHLIANGVTLANQVASSSKQVASSEWIPVSDRLPEKGEDVLVYTLTHDVLKAHCYGDRQWFAHDGIWRVVTHWMPLPEPPKEV